MIIVVSIFIFRFIKSGHQVYRVIVIEKYSYDVLYGSLLYYYTFYLLYLLQPQKIRIIRNFFNIFYIFSKKSDGLWNGI